MIFLNRLSCIMAIRHPPNCCPIESQGCGLRQHIPARAPLAESLPRAYGTDAEATRTHGQLSPAAAHQGDLHGTTRHCSTVVDGLSIVFGYAGLSGRR